MARILRNLASTGAGYACTNPLGCVMTHQGDGAASTFNIYTGLTAGGTPLGQVGTHGGAGPVNIPFNHTIRNNGTSSRLASIDTTPHNFRQL